MKLNPKTPRPFVWFLLFAVALHAGPLLAQQTSADPLPSWNEGPRKTGILDFVARVTKEGGPDFVAPADRIATFDNDGTMWCEQPIYVQVQFAVDRVKALAPQHPEWKTTQPFKSILDNDKAKLPEFSIQDFAKVGAVSHAGMTVQDFEQIVRKWLATTEHPRFHRPYTECIYQPMLELMAYLRANEFKTYIVTGGGQDFVRVFSNPVYGVPPAQVVGSAAKTKFQYGKDGQPQLIKTVDMILIDDSAGKPQGIDLMIGQRPIAAFGNSTGDQQMLEWTQASDDAKVAKAARLMMLVHHDDAKREYAYGADSKIGTFSNALMNEANERKWFVISMKEDWKVIFPFER
jgi:hypothetical protein